MQGVKLPAPPSQSKWWENTKVIFIVSITLFGVWHKVFILGFEEDITLNTADKLRVQNHKIEEFEASDLSPGSLHYLKRGCKIKHP